MTAGARSWPLLTLRQRVTLLRRIRAAVVAAATDWADVAATSKGLEPGHPLFPAIADAVRARQSALA